MRSAAQNIWLTLGIARATTNIAKEQPELYNPLPLTGAYVSRIT